MKLVALLLAAGLAAVAQQVPKTACDFDGFDKNAKLADVQTATTAYYACAPGRKCLAMTLKPGEPVVLYRTEGAWTCAYLVARKGSGQGWVPSKDIRPLDADPNPPPGAWVGTWVQGENRITITTSATQGKLAAEGEAYWHGFGDNVHDGGFSSTATPAGNHLHLEDDACKIDLALHGKYLLVDDNNECGGANVRFWSIWKRR